MADRHPNLALLERLDPSNLAASKDVFADDLVFHYFNPKLPELQGDHVGANGLRTFFEKLGSTTNGTFSTNPVSSTAIGDELVVTHTVNTMRFQDEDLTLDVVIVWRIVDGRIAEVWDIPSVHTARNRRR